MLLTGDMISSEKAKEIGLINDFVEAGQLTTTVMALAEKIASKPSSTVATVRKTFYEQAEMNLSKAYEYTSKVMKNNLLRDDAKEGISAFLKKISRLARRLMIKKALLTDFLLELVLLMQSI